MATVTKRTWKTPAGEERSAWVLTYVDCKKVRRRSQHPTKRAAEDERTRVEGEIAEGVHVADRDSITVLDAARAFLSDFEALVEAKKRERSSLRMYRQHVELHIAPFAVAAITLARLTGPDCVGFATDLETNRSDVMARRVFVTFRSILSFAIARGWCKVNPAASVRVRVASRRFAASGDDPTDTIDIPPKADLRKLLAAAEARAKDDKGRARAIVSTLLFAGLRISELRALRRRDIDLKAKTIRVAQRADRWNEIGPVKSANSARVVPIADAAVKALRVWLLAAPKSSRDLAFPNSAGNVEGYPNLYRRLWLPLMQEAKLATVTQEDDGKKTVAPNFAFHALRHAAVSAWIVTGATHKQVQMWAGHDDIQFTLNVYGHLWPDIAGSASIARRAERFFLTD